MQVQDAPVRIHGIPIVFTWYWTNRIPAKVEAVVNTREPESVAEVRSFMGLVNFSAKFIPNLAAVAEPLRQLTRKGVIFKWGEKQQEAFKALKETLASAETAYDDKDAKTRVMDWALSLFNNKMVTGDQSTTQAEV